MKRQGPSAPPAGGESRLFSARRAGTPDTAPGHQAERAERMKNLKHLCAPENLLQDTNSEGDLFLPSGHEALRGDAAVSEQTVRPLPPSSPALSRLEPQPAAVFSPPGGD